MPRQLVGRHGDQLQQAVHHIWSPRPIQQLTNQSHVWEGGVTFHAWGGVSLAPGCLQGGVGEGLLEVATDHGRFVLKWEGLPHLWGEVGARVVKQAGAQVEDDL